MKHAVYTQISWKQEENRQTTPAVCVCFLPVFMYLIIQLM